MDKEQTNNPVIGTWDKLPTEEQERKEKIDFEIGKPVEVVFLENEPVEMQGETGAYYIFNVEVSKEPRVIMTSAWSLLRKLKTLIPLAGKKAKLTKVMEKGRQHFEVEIIEPFGAKVEKIGEKMKKVGENIEKVLG